MDANLADTLAYAHHWLEIIHKPRVTQEKAEAIGQETICNFVNHFNRGFLDYRKSPTEADIYAATDLPWEETVVEGVFGHNGVLVAGSLTSARTICIEPPLFKTYYQNN